MSARGGKHFFRTTATRLLRCHTDERLGRQIHIPVLLKEIDIFPGIHVGPINLLLPGWGIGQGNELNGLDDHDMHLLLCIVGIHRLVLDRTKRRN
jgi:hypothetical protein